MAQRRHHQSKPQNRRHAPQQTIERPTPAAAGSTPKIVYGKPITLLEDNQKQVFVYSAGQWVQYAKSIAECRLECQVKELSQKINGMKRYEVCPPI